MQSCHARLLPYLCPTQRCHVVLSWLDAQFIEAKDHHAAACCLSNMWSSSAPRPHPRRHNAQICIHTLRRLRLNRRRRWWCALSLALLLLSPPTRSSGPATSSAPASPSTALAPLASLSTGPRLRLGALHGVLDRLGAEGETPRGLDEGSGGCSVRSGDMQHVLDK